MDTEQALHIAASLCRRFEGCVLHPYLDCVGVPTIGYGSTRYEDGTAVTLSDPPITKQRAEDLLISDLKTNRLRQVVGLCPGADSPQRLAALIDFAYNLGTGALRASTLRRKVNAGDWDAVPAEFLKWNRAGGKVQRGLTLRRQAEATVCTS